MTTALLTADEAARLVPGERLVIVRAGDPTEGNQVGFSGERKRWFVAPQAWVALTGPCPACDGWGVKGISSTENPHCPACLAGRRIVPLYTECPACFGAGARRRTVWRSIPCDRCNGAKQRLVGRGGIEVVPEDDGRNWRIIIDCVAT